MNTVKLKKRRDQVSISSRSVLLKNGTSNIDRFVDEFQSCPRTTPTQFHEVQSICEALQYPGFELVDLLLVELDEAEPALHLTFRSLQKKYPEIPILVLTSSENEKMAREAIELGADDYILNSELTPYCLDRTISLLLEGQLKIESLERHLDKETTLRRETYHRAKNDFAQIASLLSIAERNTSRREATSVLRRSVNRVHTISLVYELLQGSWTGGKISTDNYVRKLVNLIVSDGNQQRPVKTQVTVSDEVELKPALLKTVGLIINELVLNALEHAFGRHGGTLSISLLKQDKAVELTVEDDGAGLGDEDLEESSNQLGLTLIRDLSVRQLDGDLSVTSENGTCFRITFPIDKNR